MTFYNNLMLNLPFYHLLFFSFEGGGEVSAVHPRPDPLRLHHDRPRRLLCGPRQGERQLPVTATQQVSSATVSSNVSSEKNIKIVVLCWDQDSAVARLPPL